MSHEASPAGREPAEGYTAANSPWAAPPESDEHQSDSGGPARARAQVPQARGSASVPPPPAGGAAAAGPPPEPHPPAGGYPPAAGQPQPPAGYGPPVAQPPPTAQG